MSTFIVLNQADSICAVRHTIIFQKPGGSGQMYKTEVDLDMLCLYTGVRDKKYRLIFEYDGEIWSENVIGEVV